MGYWLWAIGYGLLAMGCWLWAVGLGVQWVTTALIVLGTWATALLVSIYGRLQEVGGLAGGAFTGVRRVQEYRRVPKNGGIRSYISASPLSSFDRGKHSRRLRSQRRCGVRSLRANQSRLGHGARVPSSPVARCRLSGRLELHTAISPSQKDPRYARGTQARPKAKYSGPRADTPRENKRPSPMIEEGGLSYVRANGQ
jgi:hypothetical protein